MKIDSEESILPKDQIFHVDMPSKLPSINTQENQNKQSLKSSSKKNLELNLDKKKIIIINKIENN